MYYVTLNNVTTVLKKTSVLLADHQLIINQLTVNVKPFVRKLVRNVLMFLIIVLNVKKVTL